MKILIVGAGIYGATCARILHDADHTVKVIDKSDVVAGHIYDKPVDDYFIHVYGAHIFHTKHKHVWKFVNKFAEFNHYVNSPLANYKGNYYNLPFNMNTFNQLLGTTNPVDAKIAILEDTPRLTHEPINLEEQAISMVGKTIYKVLIKDYTEKQWGRKCTDLPPSIIKRLPLRFTYDNNYFSDPYQGIPLGGYTNMIERMLEGIDVELNREFNKEDTLDYDLVIYTGAIDQYYNFKFGKLEYRTLKFKHETLTIPNYQGVAVVNYTSHDTEYTRIIEHKHFQIHSKSNKSIITYEYPKEWEEGDTPYYPVNDEKNNALYKKYKELNSDNVVFAGRMGDYAYYDMDKSIDMAMTLCERIGKIAN